ncbi:MULTISPECIES: hypothetical protein [unclassified Methylobacterium]|uniref:hypothetical protein n=1 Tax=unclassified Methylobacterium TaxID=2615210 RepID=UPI0006FB95F7|nr:MULTISPECIES: hypothetical protein [unclassified Methylobacterium]KQO45567.1 hypothetical protein ASF24_10295 [Methylobacterium sp. Leaf86]KQO92690.1 hypothetical protein ASF32_21540 [Methylobacterium sp. Leaf91]
MDLSAAGAALGSLKTAFDILKTMAGLRDANLVREKALELQGVIYSAQERALTSQAAQSALVKRIDDLETEITRLKAWDGEKERYELKSLGAGVFAYAPKPGMEGSEPEHKLCANCFQHREKSILQQETRHPGRVVMLVCSACHAELVIAGARTAEVSGMIRRP